MTLSAGEYLIGLGFFLSVLAASLVIAALFARRRLGHLVGVPRVLAAAVVATVALVGVHLVPATLGILSRETVAATAVTCLGVAILLPGRTSAPRPAWPPSLSEEAPLSRRLAFAGCAGVAIYVIALLVALGDEPATNVDTTTFHLPGVGSWIQTGSIWQIDQFVADQAHGNYPNTGNVVELFAVLPWQSDFLIRFVALPFLLATALATYGIGRELRAPQGAAALLAALAVSLPAVTIFAVERPVPDAIAVAGLSTGAFFLLRHNRTELRSELVVAGLALGLGFGTKWYGVSAAVAIVTVWTLARLVSRRGAAAVTRQSLLVLGLVLATGGIWLLRNWIESGNPVFPVGVSVLGLEVFDAPPDFIREAYLHTIASYATDAAAWKDHILPAYREFLAFPGAFLAAGLAVTLASFRADALRDARPAAAAVGAGAGAIALAIVYAVTPGSALGPEGSPGGAGVNSRYLVPAIPLAAGVCALGMAAAGRWRHTLEVLALVAIGDGLLQSTPVSAAALAAGGLLFAAAAAVWFSLERRSPAGRATAARLAVAPLVALALAAGYQLQRNFNDGRYLDDEVLAAVASDDEPPRRIGLGGAWDLDRTQPVLPAFGPRLRNEVAYVGRFEDGMLRPHEREGDFVAALDRGDFDLLVVGDRPLPEREPLPVAEWVRRAGFREVARDEELAVFAAPASDRAVGAG